MTLAQLVRAYGATRAALDPREQEADIIRRVTGGLRAVREDDGPARMRAVADNRRLWLAMESALVHPSNQLPARDGRAGPRHRLPDRGERAGRRRAGRRRLA
jgi:hypothetical protein